jgi:hypothetical protein
VDQSSWKDKADHPPPPMLTFPSALALFKLRPFQEILVAK